MREVMQLQECDGNKLIIHRGWLAWAMWLWYWLHRPKPLMWVRLKEPAKALTQPKLAEASLGTVGQFIERNGFFKDVLRVQWADSAVCWCHEDDLEVVRIEDYQQQHSCQHVLDEGEEGEILCNRPASNECRDCHLFYCDAHFNEFMQRCDEDSEVVAARYL